MYLLKYTKKTGRTSNNNKEIRPVSVMAKDYKKDIFGFWEMGFELSIKRFIAGFTIYLFFLTGLYMFEYECSSFTKVYPFRFKPSPVVHSSCSVMVYPHFLYKFCAGVLSSVV